VRNFIQPGNVVALPAPTGGVSSGDVVIVGALVGIAAYDAVEAAPVEVKLDGVFELPKAAEALDPGDAAYWTGTAVTATPGTNTLLGAVTEAAATDAPTVRVRLNGVTTG